MKAQITKNAIIVPTGSKKVGFYVKNKTLPEKKPSNATN